MKVKAVAVVFMVLLLVPSIEAQSTAPIRYFYDDLGRLTRVVDQSGNYATYVYDAVGNILAIQRGSVASSSLAVFNITPQRGGTTMTITIQGQGFSTNPALNIVTVNGVQWQPQLRIRCWCSFRRAPRAA